MGGWLLMKVVKKNWRDGSGCFDAGIMLINFLLISSGRLCF